MSTTTLAYGRRRVGILRGWAGFDSLLLLSTLAILAFGLILIYSASQGTGAGPLASLSNPVTKQALFGVLGLGLMFAFSRFDYHYLTHYGWVLYGIGVLSLIFILGIGHTSFGSTRWFNLGPIQVQPSEFAKLATIVALAKFFSDRQERIRDMRTLLLSLAVVAPMAGLVFLEPDLGTAVVFLTIWLGVVLIAGVRRRHLLVLLGIFLAILPFAWTFFVADYQVQRISTLLNPYADQNGLGAGYDNIQSEIAVGSGQIFGQGLGNGDQTNFGFLQVPTKDFIFSVLGEETGFVGAMVLFGLFIILLMRGIRVAQVALDTEGRLLAVGIVAFILMQTFINVAVNLSLFPVTGIPLPFVSAGGSSLLTLFVSLGILQNILMRRRAYRTY